MLCWTGGTNTRSLSGSAGLKVLFINDSFSMYIDICCRIFFTKAYIVIVQCLSIFLSILEMNVPRVILLSWVKVHKR